MQTLREWKSNVGTKKKALVIEGLRQIGKTFIVRQFAKEILAHYDTYKVRQCVKLGECNIGENGEYTNPPLLPGIPSRGMIFPKYPDRKTAQ